MSQDEAEKLALLKPRRTVHSTNCYALEGANEDNSLWVHEDSDSAGSPIFRSTWVLTDEQRKKIAEGSNVEVILWEAQIPMSVALDDSELRGVDVDTSQMPELEL